MSGYDARFFDCIREGCRQSAEAVVPVILDHFQPETVVADVGCGEGWWGRVFLEAGCGAVGLEGSAVGCQIPVIESDLEHEFTANLPRVDLALCLEVAEHLSPERAPSFVGELCDLASTVVFSAAVPGQGGEGHLNEQWPGYWADLFAQRGYRGSGELRWAIWTDERVKWWYRQNLLVFGDLPPSLPEDDCAAVIHPEAWEHHGHG